MGASVEGNESNASGPVPMTRSGMLIDLLWVGSGGVLVFFAGYPAEVPWLQLVAFIPLLAVCIAAPSWRRAALFGGVFGLARHAPLGIMLEGLVVLRDGVDTERRFVRVRGSRG